MDEVHSHHNGTLVREKRKGVLERIKVSLFQSGLPKSKILDNISLLCFHDKPYAWGWGSRSMRT